MSVIARASLVEYFKEQLEGALGQQRVPITPAPPATSSNCWPTP